MNEMYERILTLCQQRNIKPGRLCADTGLSRGLMTDLKMGRTRELSAKNTKIIADYFGVTTDYLLTGLGDKEKAPALKDERNQQPELDDEQLKVAYFRGADPSLTKEDLDAMWEDAKNFRDFILEKKRREKHGE